MSPIASISALPFLTFYHFARALLIYHFTNSPIPQFRGPSNSSRPGHPIRPSHVTNTCRDTQTGLPMEPSRYNNTIHTFLPRQSSQFKHPCRYSYPTQSNNSYTPMVRVRGVPTLTLTSNKPTSTSRDNHSSQPSMRIHSCQSIQSFLPTLPSQSCRLITLVSIVSLLDKVRPVSIHKALYTAISLGKVTAYGR